MSSNDHISSTEQEKLDQFQVITAFKDDEYDEIIALLRNNYWNLEVALSKYFDGELNNQANSANGSGNGVNQDHQGQINSEQAGLHRHNRFTSSPSDDIGFANQELNPREFMMAQGLLPQLPIVRPLSNNWKLRPGLIRTSGVWEQFSRSPILFILLLIPRAVTLILSALGWALGLIFPDSPEALPGRPSLTEFDFTKHYEELIADKSNIEFYKKNFNDAFYEAKNKTKFLLLIMISNNEQSNIFLKKVLNNQMVSKLINNDEIIVYAGNVNEAQMFEVAKNIRARTCPSVYLIGNVSSGPNGISSMSVLSRVPTKSTTSFATKLSREVERYTPEFVAKRVEQEELSYSRELKTLQDKAYEESLLADRLKQQQKEEELKAQKAKEELKVFNKINRKKFYASIAPLFDQLNQLPKSEVASIQFRLPNGERLIQKFSKRNTLFDIYSYIDLQNFLKGLSKDEVDSFKFTEKNVHEDYQHKFNFELISPFPRFSVPVKSDVFIKDVDQLWPNGNILIEYNENDDDDDDEDDEDDDDDEN